MLQTSITLETIVVACKDQVSRDIEGEVVILSMKSGVYYGLNAVGAAIWEWIQEPTAAVTVRDKLLQQYDDVDAVACAEYLLGFLQEMAEAGLVEVPPTNSAHPPSAAV